MWRSKKFILIGLLTVVVLAGTLGGIAVAHADDEDSGQPQLVKIDLLDKVAEIYEKNTGTAIDSRELQKAFEQALDETRIEALDNYLQNLVDEGEITQEQADQCKAWLDSRPEFPTDEFRQWLESRPDIPGLFGTENRGGMMFGGGHRGFLRFGVGFGLGLRACLPD